jgi:hypothetical protein
MLATKFAPTVMAAVRFAAGDMGAVLTRAAGEIPVPAERVMLVMGVAVQRLSATAVQLELLGRAEKVTVSPRGIQAFV